MHAGRLPISTAAHQMSICFCLPVGRRFSSGLSCSHLAGRSGAAFGRTLGWYALLTRAVTAKLPKLNSASSFLSLKRLKSPMSLDGGAHIAAFAGGPCSIVNLVAAVQGFKRQQG